MGLQVFYKFLYSVIHRNRLTQIFIDYYLLDTRNTTVKQNKLKHLCSHGVYVPVWRVIDSKGKLVKKKYVCSLISAKEKKEPRCRFLGRILRL